VRRKIRFTAIKENIFFEGKQDLQTKVTIALFGLFAEVKRDPISERTKEGRAAARAQDRLLDRPKGSFAKIMDVSTTNLRHFIRTRKLAPEAPKGTSKSRGRQGRP
jgi:DNA invertase Pin-like site-specific DNA recombinase